VSRQDSSPRQPEYRVGLLSTRLRRLVWAPIMKMGLTVIRIITEWFKIGFCESICVGWVSPRASLHVVAFCPVFRLVASPARAKLTLLAHDQNLPRRVVKKSSRQNWEWALSRNAMS
jgi:hypothetical protein